MYTPGPWRTKPLIGTKQVSIVPHYDDTDRRSVASVVCVAGRPQMDYEANARLIAAAPKLLGALEGLREDLQTRLDAATEGATEADGLVLASDVNHSWRSWLFDVMSTHGDIAQEAIAEAKGE